MNAALVAVFCLLIFGVGYRWYGRYVSRDVFGLDAGRTTPAHRYEDGVDYVPSNRWVLFGHHFASISGLGPIVGPAIAVIWGWLPAMLWVVFGTLLIGAVHDLTTLGVSLRNRGRSIGDVASRTISDRSRMLFLLLIFFLIALAMGVFAYIIALLFAKLYPATVVPVFALMVIAMVMGVFVYRGSVGLTPASVVGVTLLALVAWYTGIIEVAMTPEGVARRLVLPLGVGSASLPGFGVETWTYLLMGYAFVASVLPVWLLLQPRDYLNAYLLAGGLAALYGGLFWLQPSISAPALNVGEAAPADLPPLFPILFITVACGAISGFHSLVSSGTTAKQLDSESDGRMVGYGGMVFEGVLALMVLLACVAGLGGLEAWQSHYASWSQASGLGPKLDAFIVGGATFVASLGQHVGIGPELAKILIALIAVSFAMTTLDSGTRLLRYNIEELADALSAGEEASPLVNRWTSSLVAVGAIGFFALLEVGGQPAGIFLWVLFGASNQLLAALGLLTVSVYLYKRGRPTLPTLVPMGFMIVVTFFALGLQFFKQMPMVLREPLGNLLGIGAMPSEPGSWVIFGLVVLISVLAVWFVVEAVGTYRRYSPEQAPAADHAPS